MVNEPRRADGSAASVRTALPPAFSVGALNDAFRPRGSPLVESASGPSVPSAPRVTASLRPAGSTTILRSAFRALLSATGVTSTSAPAAWRLAAELPVMANAPEAQAGTSGDAVSVKRAVSPGRSRGRSKAPEMPAGNDPSRSEMPEARPLVCTANSADAPGARD